MTRKSQRKSLKSSSGWSAIPGTKLSVDIGRGVSNAQHDDLASTGDVSRWISPHYNDNDDDDDDEKKDSAASRDLYDPQSAAEEGAGDFGMLFSLEVIRGDSYRVEKSGDETTGFVTKVVYTDPSAGAVATTATNEKRDHRQPPKEKKSSVQRKRPLSSTQPAKDSNLDTDISTSTTKLNKRQRQQLKRKARLLETEQQQQQQIQTAVVDAKIGKHNNDAHTKQHVADPTSEQLLALQSAWSTPLHSTLLRSLHAQNYTHPTPIQASAPLRRAAERRRVTRFPFCIGSWRTRKTSRRMRGSMAERKRVEREKATTTMSRPKKSQNERGRSARWCWCPLASSPCKSPTM